MGLGVESILASARMPDEQSEQLESETAIQGSNVNDAIPDAVRSASRPVPEVTMDALRAICAGQLPATAPKPEPTPRMCRTPNTIRTQVRRIGLLTP